MISMEAKQISINDVDDNNSNIIDVEELQSAEKEMENELIAEQQETINTFENELMILNSNIKRFQEAINGKDASDEVINTMLLKQDQDPFLNNEKNEWTIEL